MNFLGPNIKFLRKTRKLTQEQLAHKIGVKRPLIGAYEEGRAEPKLQTIQNLAHYFKVTLDELIGMNMPDGGEISGPADVRGTQMRILSITVDKEEKELCSLIPVKAAAGYLNGYGDIDYIESLPRFNFPFPELDKNRTYRTFQIEGDSMLPVPSGAYITCEYVQDWNSIKNNECYVLVTKEEGVVYKRVLNNLNEGELLLQSDNPQYESYTVKAGGVVEVWRALGYTTFDLPDKTESEQKVDDLMSAVIQIKDDVKWLKDAMDK